MAQCTAFSIQYELQILWYFAVCYACVKNGHTKAYVHLSIDFHIPMAAHTIWFTKFVTNL